ncbi:hypothetical protein [Streptomyces sp. A012304]|uniref:hypothetical protein n=1 Tax=Streptomyces sp. A012304 TaxID=375446 RepID=UPI002230C23B|nr:hypothetical protein [Streptomyces sp. A012304]GKQ36556.1 hypothetical protein ALMP_30970 [Streptomyces sp. A012304]
MSTHPVTPTAGNTAPVALRFALIPVHGYGLEGATVARMLDPQGSGQARLLHPGEAVPYGARPVLLAETTVYSATCVEHMIRGWSTGLPRPWLVLISDAPARPAPAARYLFRALGSRLAGTATVPYLPVLRSVESADEALQDKDVKAAAERLRRQMEGR